MARQKSSTGKEIKVLEPITPVQQAFIEALLQGKNVTESAICAGVSRRTACTWLHDPEHPVHLEYEKQRIAQQQNFYVRIAGIHEAALKAIEESLSESAPLGLRFQAARFIYQTHLQHLAGVRQAKRPFDLVKAAGEMENDREYFDTYTSHKLRNLPDS